MSKTGKTLKNITTATAKAGGTASEFTGKAFGEMGKAMGAGKKTCDKIENSAFSVAKDLYKNSNKVGKKVEKTTDQMIHKSKKAMDTVKNKLS